MDLLDPRAAFEYSVGLPDLIEKAERLAKEAVETGDDALADRLFEASDSAASFFLALEALV